MWASIYATAQLVIAITCVWAILSPRVSDGVVGKAALVLMLFASLGCIAWAIHWPWEVQRPGALFSAAVACMAVRCWSIKSVKPRLRRRKGNRKCN